ncbi:hypothetical protein OK016_25040 [Vibrio chagasii]|nr:hypothetical protein [Vibrio chagasii]
MPALAYLGSVIGGSITGEAVIAAADASPKRLQTDYIDPYQLLLAKSHNTSLGKHLPNQIRFSDIDRTTA